MRNLTTLLVSLVATSVMALDPPSASPAPYDSVQRRGVAVLEANLEHLKDLLHHTNEFKNAYLPGAKIYCDVCPVSAPQDVANYVFEVGSRFPNGFPFTYQITNDKIEMVTWDLGRYDLRIPFVKEVPELDAQGKATGRTRRWNLVASIKMDYSNQSFKITEVASESTPSSSVLMLELSPLWGIGSLKFDDLQGLEPTTKASSYRIGVAYYFNPTKGANKGNVWYKVGLRVGVRQTKLTLDAANFDQADLPLKPIPQAPDSAHHIDVRTNVKDYKEQINSTVIELPLGISKRWSLSRAIDLSLEFELGVGLELSRKVQGDYVTDEVGTNHYLMGSYQRASGGANVVYDAPSAAVVSDAGDQIDFFTGRSSTLDGIQTKGKLYPILGLNPSIFIRHLDQIKYNIGFRLALMGNQTTTGTVDANYFANDGNDERPALTTLTSSKFSSFIGLTFGLIL